MKDNRVTRVTDTNGKKGYTWKSSDGEETYVTNIGWEVDVTEQAETFLDNYGGMTQSYFEYMKKEEVVKMRILIYTDNLFTVVSLVEFLGKEGEVIHWTHARGKQFSEIIQKKYILELKELTTVREVIPSDIIKEEYPNYGEPRKDNSTGIMYKGNEVLYSTRDKVEEYTLELTKEGTEKVLNHIYKDEEFPHKVGSFVVRLSKEKGAFGNMGDLYIHTESGDILSRKYVDTYFTDEYGVGATDAEIEEITVSNALYEIQKRMNSEYRELKEMYKKRPDITAPFDEILGNRLRREKMAFDSIEADVEEMIKYGNTGDSVMLGRGMLEYLFKHAIN